MSDPTTARDRAIETIADEFAPYGGGPGEAEIAVDALLASPLLLRALAGAPDVTALDRLRDIFERAGAGERAWGAHYAAMVMRGQLRIEHASTGPSAAVITGRYRSRAAAPEVATSDPGKGDDEPPAVRVPCRSKHGHHDLPPVDVARIVAALSCAAIDSDFDDDIEPCPLEALDWARDQEMYAETVDPAMEAAGLADDDEPEGMDAADEQEQRPEEVR